MFAHSNNFGDGLVLLVHIATYESSGHIHYVCGEQMNIVTMRAVAELLI